MSVPLASARWPAAAVTAALWAAAAASAVFWGLRLAAPSESIAPPPVSGARGADADPAAIGRLLGARSEAPAVVAAPEAASRFALLGVIADSGGAGAALIAVDGKPPRPYRVGATLAEGYVLQSLDARAARIGGQRDAAAAFTLQLPALPLAVNGPPLPAPVMPPPG